MFMLQQDKKQLHYITLQLHLTRYEYILESTRSIEMFFSIKNLLIFFVGQPIFVGQGTVPTVPIG